MIDARGALTRSVDVNQPAVLRCIRHDLLHGRLAVMTGYESDTLVGRIGGCKASGTEDDVFMGNTHHGMRGVKIQKTTIGKGFYQCRYSDGSDFTLLSVGSVKLGEMHCEKTSVKRMKLGVKFELLSLVHDTGEGNILQRYEPNV